MSALLEIVRESRELRDQAEREYRRAIVRAHEGGESLRAIGRAAGVHFTWVGRLLKRERDRT